MAYITLNKNHFFNNLDIIAKLTCDKDKIALVLKDNAYGHGILEVAHMSKEYGIKKAVVQSNAEAELIEDFFEYILVLADIPKVANPKIRYTINDINAVKNFPKDTRVELKVNTGMNRNGIQMQELATAFTLIKQQKLQLEAVFTHHACADELNELYEIQKKNFKIVKENSDKSLRFHSCNSAALFRESDFDEDMVRVGIAVYGCLEVPFKSLAPQLKSVLSLYAKKISSKTLELGESVGYGVTFKAEKQMIVSNYDFGYGHGFLRACSNIFQTKDGVKIAGRVSMDNCSFISDKDELMIFDDARDVSVFAKTISYEVLTSLKANIKRTII
ncbi:MAG: alanine racemase [Sulfurimonas sp.]